MSSRKKIGFAAIELPRIRRRLLRWYERAKRDLPWRRTRDPYRIWVSEIMLQQTRVEAVVPYYRNFLRQFPSVAALACAPEQRVLAAWSGLGYYSRARNLQRAAQAMMHDHAGKFPDDEQGALALPGVGRYTAAAVLSIAHGAPLAVLDGNVARVLSRLLALAADVRDTRGKARLWGCAEQLLDARRPGDFNQAMMELGATVCVPASPRCGKCPLAQQCRAHRRGEEAKFPPARRKQRESLLTLRSAIVHDQAGRVLLQQRPAGVHWMAGFWEIPTWKVGERNLEGGEHHSVLRLRLVMSRPLGMVRHTITRFRIVAEVREAQLVDNGKKLVESERVRWATPAELNNLPVSTITRKALRLEQNRGL